MVSRSHCSHRPGFWKRAGDGGGREGEEAPAPAQGCRRHWWRKEADDEEVGAEVGDEHPVMDGDHAVDVAVAPPPP